MGYYGVLHVHVAAGLASVRQRWIDWYMCHSVLLCLFTHYFKPFNEVAMVFRPFYCNFEINISAIVAHVSVEQFCKRI